MGADVQGQVVEEEAPEHEAFSLVHPMIHREQATHLAHQDGWRLVCCQGEGHQSLVPLEGVQGVELREAFHEGLVGILIRRKLDEINNLGDVSMVEGLHAVVELGEARGKALDGELGLSLGKPNPSIICPELREFDRYSIDVKGS